MEVDTYNKLFYATSFNSLTHLGLYDCYNILSPSPQALQAQQQQQYQYQQQQYQQQQQQFDTFHNGDTTRSNIGNISVRSKATTARSMTGGETLISPHTPHTPHTPGGGGSEPAGGLNTNRSGVGGVNTARANGMTARSVSAIDQHTSNVKSKEADFDRDKGKLFLKVFPALESLHITKIPVKTHLSTHALIYTNTSYLWTKSTLFFLLLHSPRLHVSSCIHFILF